MDALIEMVSKLKNEKEVYKVQVKHLVQLINSPKVKAINGTSNPSAAAAAAGALDRRNIPPKELSVPITVDGASLRAAGGSASGSRRASKGLHISEQPTPSTPGEGDLDLARAMYKLISGNRCSRSSTVTTFVPSSPDDIASVNDLRDMLEDSGIVDNSSKPLSPTSPWSAAENLNGQVVNPANGIRISPSAMATLKESIQVMHALNNMERNTLSPHSVEEYPKVMPCAPDAENPSRNKNNRTSSLQGALVPSVYNGNNQQNGCQNSELVDLGQATNEPVDEEHPVRPKDKTKKKNREKLNFIVYI